MWLKSILDSFSLSCSRIDLAYSDIVSQPETHEKITDICGFSDMGQFIFFQIRIHFPIFW